MSKPNNRIIIQQKKEFQDELLNSVNLTNRKVTSWLKPLDSKHEQEEIKSESFEDFFQMPIVNTKSGISFDNNDGNKDKILKISSIDGHIKGRKTLKGNDKSNNQFDSILNREIKTDSSVIKALKNQLRNDNVKKIRQNQNNVTKSQNKPVKSRKFVENRQNDSDSDEEMKLKKSIKKKSANVMSFGNKRKRK